MIAHCKAKKLNGESCGARAGKSGFCFMHDVGRKKEADHARLVGGKHRRRIPSGLPFPEGDPLTVKGLAIIIAATMRQCWALENSLARGRVMAYLAATQRAIIEANELEARITAIEATLKLREAKP